MDGPGVSGDRKTKGSVPPSVALSGLKNKN